MDNRFLVRNLPMDWSWQDVHGWLSTFGITANWVHLFSCARPAEWLPQEVDVEFVVQALPSSWLTHRQVQVRLCNETERVHFPGAKPKSQPLASTQQKQPPPTQPKTPPRASPTMPSPALAASLPVTPPKATEPLPVAKAATAPEEGLGDDTEESSGSGRG